MKLYTYPNKAKWDTLLARPLFDRGELSERVKVVMDDVKRNGDAALYAYTKKFDGVQLEAFRVTEHEILKAVNKTPKSLKSAIQVAYENIASFHKAQKIVENTVETMPGIKCWRKSVPIEKIGIYIPGGSAPLFSTILMLGIPAKIAGCKDMILCTPPNSDQTIHPAILYTANLVGISKIYKVGGAQAIAGMAYGTESIPCVYKIFGPGNQYVTEAKSLAQQDGIAIDMPAGPSEVLIIADHTCRPAFVAADLLSQAEHGADSQVILLSNDRSVIKACLDEVHQQVETLPRKAIALQALANSRAILMETIQDCLDFNNAYAPEHLILAMDNTAPYQDRVTHAGSVFLGHYSCESAGDYASGTNHTLPTNGFAKQYSGVSLDSFVKKITYQELNKTGLMRLGPAIEIMAKAEGLMAHKQAVSIRLKNEAND